MFLARGLVGARTRQIAEEAGVKEAILYGHFTSKEEIFAAAVFDPLEELVTEIVDRINLYDNGDDQAKHRVAVLEPLEQRLADRVAEAVATGPDPSTEPREMLAELHRSVLSTLVETAPMLSIALFGDQNAGREFYRDRIEPLLEEWIEATYRRLKGKRRGRLQLRGHGGELHDRGDDGVPGGREGIAGRVRGPERADERRQPLRQIEKDDILFRAEVPEERAAGVVGALGDVVDRGGLVPPLLEEIDGRTDQVEAGLLLLALPQTPHDFTVLGSF